MEAERLVGFIDEDDILRHAFGKPERFNDPVRAAMHTNFLVVEPTLAMRNLVAMLDVQPYAAVMNQGEFHGLITRADVLNYLRRQMTSAPAQ
jgi:cystathionine beta-synthase